METKKMRGDERRKFILQLLKKSEGPVTGRKMAEKTNVSRQVIAGDISLLRAKGEPIIATSQGYMYMKKTEPVFEKTIVCQHTPDQTEEELNLLVDHGVTVKNVTVEHSVYGEITASIMVSNRLEVKQFLRRIKETGSSFLSELTNGIHLHTISATSEEALEQAIRALKSAGFLIKEDQ